MNRTALVVGFAGLSLASGCRPSAPPASPDAAPAGVDGAAVFLRVCAVCHQPNGAGVPGVFPPLAGSEILAAPDPSRAVRIVLHGLQGPLTVGGKSYQGVMPAQGPLLNDAEIAAALTHARRSWGNRAPPVSADSVRAIRASTPRTTFWTWPELVRATPRP